MSTTRGPEMPKASLHNHKPRHQLTRSISELSSPIRLHRHHSTRRTKEKEEKERDREREHWIQPRHSFDERARFETVTPNMSPDQSRRASIIASANEDGALQATATNTTPGRMAARKEDQSQQEKRSAEARQSGLKKALVDVAAVSNANTRRLDAAYYSVLEKVGTLQNTIDALRELATLSHEVNETFERETTDLSGDIDSQLDAFGAFEEQQERVETLQARVQEGRVRVTGLSKRLDSVRRRVEGWEQADREWQARTRRRLKAVWVLTSVVILVLVLLLLSAQYAPAEFGSLEEKAVGFANDSLRALKTMTKKNNSQEQTAPLPWELPGSRGNDAATVNLTLERDHDLDAAADEVLRVLDEL